MKKGVHAIYDGRVQGVGFRFTARGLANKLNLAGWVKNLMDGRVELFCEGEEERLKQFLGLLDENMRSYIFNKDIIWQDYQGDFKGFDIRF